MYLGPRATTWPTIRYLNWELLINWGQGMNVQVWYFVRSRFFVSSNLLVLPYHKARLFVFRFIIEYSSLRDFYRPLHIRSISLYEEIWKMVCFGLVLKLEISYRESCIRVICKVIMPSWAWVAPPSLDASSPPGCRHPQSHQILLS
jgi:hypothetical protein